MKNGLQMLEMLISLLRVELQPFLPCLNFVQTNEACGQRSSIDRTLKTQKHLQLSDPIRLERLSSENPKMYSCKISKRDGEFALTLPDDLVSRLSLKEGQTLFASLKDSTIILRQGDSPCYSLDELLVATDQKALAQANADSEWLEPYPRVGREII